MKVKLEFLKRFHLDSRYMLLTARNIAVIREFFDALDARHIEGLDDIQFVVFIRAATDVSEKEAYTIFDMFDVDNSGHLEFDEFYLLVCMLIALKDNEVKQFLYRHWRTCFELLDDDGSKSISREEFERFGSFFSFDRRNIKKLFTEFDVTGGKELDAAEFRMFTFACLDKQVVDKKKRKKKKKTPKSETEMGMDMAAASSAVLSPSISIASSKSGSSEDFSDGSDGEGVDSD